MDQDSPSAASISCMIFCNIGPMFQLCSVVSSLPVAASESAQYSSVWKVLHDSRHGLERVRAVLGNRRPDMQQQRRDDGGHPIRDRTPASPVIPAGGAPPRYRCLACGDGATHAQAIFDVHLWLEVPTTCVEPGRAGEVQGGRWKAGSLELPADLR